MTVVPTQVSPNTGVRKLSLRNFRSGYFESFCHNCTWISFMYPTEREAQDIADFHSDRCTRRINEERALEVDVIAILAEELQHGHQILLRDLRTMDVENINVVNDTVLITYNIDRLESQLMDLPVGHVVKVVS